MPSDRSGSRWSSSGPGKLQSGAPQLPQPVACVDFQNGAAPKEVGSGIAVKYARAPNLVLTNSLHMFRANSSKDFIKLSPASRFNFDGPFTLAFWMIIDRLPTNSVRGLPMVWNYETTGPGRYRGFYCGMDSRKLHFHMYSGTNSVEVGLSACVKITSPSVGCNGVVPQWVGSVSL